jgi:hypothetical protein
MTSACRRAWLSASWPLPLLQPTQVRTSLCPRGSQGLRRLSLVARGGPSRSASDQWSPGRYLIAAVPSPQIIVPTEPAVVERLRPLAVPVTLVAGETAKVEVPVSRPQQGGERK